MGKRIIQQRRGRGTSTYRVKRKAYSIRVSYPNQRIENAEGEIIKIINSPAHSSPLCLIKIGKIKFFNIAAKGIHEGMKIKIGKNAELQYGDVAKLKDIAEGTSIFNIESNPLDGGKLIRAAGTSGKILKKEKNSVSVYMPSKKERKFDANCRATIGNIAASGRLEKPIVKAGKKWHMMKAKGKLYPRTSAVKMNVVDHPFGSGRGKNIGKTKTAPRNAPPGRKVGTLRPRRVGKRN
ncbi:50S ribosomal protein L2 [Candidatus Pacearchaeota archaeon CG_4_9_14_3_um_filter_31_7]|nr:MAG: 50S ribosomal protein L2 [Candidatus Pacearchaeota archaeon CG1_02_31_27]PIN92361.1 MAG: 50S ribosomal protein L2 [Candidatus Pacearchaeota archaeon CG10_big_fil_rev_8_21_14_0_10_31_59]PIZ80663.1 MAG: 50S ribosomal protein L2 [Candidatus Pacearchaeota archaeon CG_4_10_14_0_2_um_filter_31_10]PJA70632.1 MAG: 50S ribosomal protein L2 [Candidatus Pacearchaeota archaeon CG_4_9_14_3_um_filter_31_7]